MAIIAVGNVTDLTILLTCDGVVTLLYVVLLVGVLGMTCDGRPSLRRYGHAALEEKAHPRGMTGKGREKGEGPTGHTRAWDNSGKLVIPDGIRRLLTGCLTVRSLLCVIVHGTVRRIGVRAFADGWLLDENLRQIPGTKCANGTFRDRKLPRFQQAAGQALRILEEKRPEKGGRPGGEQGREKKGREDGKTISRERPGGVPSCLFGTVFLRILC